MSDKFVFVIHPFSKDFHWLYGIVANAAESVGSTASRIDSLRIDSYPKNSLHQAVNLATVIVADISGANPNVMYEVGYAQAIQKPLILVANSSRSVPFEFSGMPVLIYDTADLDSFNSRLASLIHSALQNPESFTVSDLVSSKSGVKNNVFISYSHCDKLYLERLLVHLKPLERENLIDLWVDTRLRGGDVWKKEIEKALDRATVAIILVSADFLASDFITDNELPPLLRNAENRGTRIIPLIVKPCRFTRDKDLKHFHSVNDPNRSLIMLSVGEQEEIYDSVAEEVERSLE